jgi:hypothetical protein
MANIKKIQEAMTGAEIDALLLISPVNRLYATGFHNSDGAVIITKDRAFFITDSRYIEAAEEAVRDAKVLFSHTEKRIIQWLQEIIRDCGIKTLGAEEESLSYSEYLNLEKKLNMKLTPSQSILKKLRASKSRQELENIKAAQAIAERAFEDVLGIIKPGLTEREIAAELTYRMLKYGGEGKLYAHALHGDGKQVKSPAVNIRRGYHVVAAGADVEDSHQGSRLSRGCEHCRSAPFKGAYFGRHMLGCGVLQPCIEEPRGLQIEEPGQVLAAAVFEGGTLNYGYLPGLPAGRAVARVNAFCSKPHGKPSFPIL